MNNNQSIVINLRKSTLESERLKLLSELKLVHSAKSARPIKRLKRDKVAKNTTEI